MSGRVVSPGLAAVVASLLACGVTEPDPATEPEPIAHDTVPPQVHISYPHPNALLFHHGIEVTVDAIDDQVVDEVALAVDGVTLASDRDPPWGFVWDTDGFSQGDYMLRATAYDTAGNSAEHDVTVRLRDIVLITEIEVTLTYDGVIGSALEIEVHLYDDDTDSFLGCSGAGSGLKDVDLSNRRYAVEAYFEKPPLGADVLLYEDVEHRNVRIEVTEDDADECPVPAHTGIGPNVDDLVGTSQPIKGTGLANPMTLGFDNVVHLAISRGRMSLAAATALARVRAATNPRGKP